MGLIITAPDEVFNIENAHNISLFLAGGITNCPDWQSEMINEFENFPITIYNPRRENFPIDDPKASDEQITWEYAHLQTADIISFWFSKGSLNPIVLYELGMWGNSKLHTKKIVIGIDPAYERKNDVIMQSSLANPFFDYFDSIKDMSIAIRTFVIDLKDKNRVS